MLSHLLFHLTRYNLFEDRLFRAGAASVFASLLVFLLMPYYIAMLNKLDATSDFDHGKRHAPPILGGMLLVGSVTIASLCFVNLNAYSISALLILLAYSTIGGIDDIIKIRNKK